MNKKRLLKLADLLEADAANKKGMKFDLGTVAEPSSGKSKTPAVDCGTTGCAMGLAAVSKVFKRAGLDYKIHQKDLEPSVPWEITLYMNGDWVGYDEAAERLFEIDSHEANHLFNPSEYGGHIKGARGERLVARRIRTFVENKGCI